MPRAKKQLTYVIGRDLWSGDPRNAGWNGAVVYQKDDGGLISAIVATAHSIEWAERIAKALNDAES